METATQATPFVIDAVHSSVAFSIRHLVFAKVRGQFRVLSGTLEVGADGIPAKISAEVKTDSIDTRDEGRDAHLRSADFLECAAYPVMTFESTGIQKTSDTEFDITGDLTLHGTTRSIELAGSVDGRGADPWGNDRISYTAKGKISRKDFGLTWSQTTESGGLLVGDEVSIELDIQAIPVPKG